MVRIPRLAGFGSIIRGPNGNCLRGRSGHIRTDFSFVYEPLAIWHDLLLAWGSGFRSVLCETDCWEAYNLIHQDSLEACDHENLILRIKDSSAASTSRSAVLSHHMHARCSGKHCGFIKGFATSS
ncbi:hypothetical protein PIB30_007390 [Stylosanthes scabra]|uniref:RNase H type-1 domain-containing protein n=1 Tax=Stylosanthes scabra TaxID=79078 RepID=A0ABU6Z3A7_9FABA|nr:hypothetical protein [Stylosanthes scabra]